MSPDARCQMTGLYYKELSLVVNQLAHSRSIALPLHPAPLHSLINMVVAATFSPALATTVGAYIGAIYSVLSCLIIGHKALIDYSHLRIGCVGLAIMTAVLGVTNAMRATNSIPEPIFFLLQALFMVMFVDLMVAITFNLAAKLYDKTTTTYAPYGLSIANALYVLTMLGSTLHNIFVILSLVLQRLFNQIVVGGDFNTAGRIMFIVALVFAYWYAFYPVIRMKTGVNDRQSGVAAVGAWYLTGMGFLTLLHVIPISISAVYPGVVYKEIDMKVTTIAVVLSIPPSARIIIFIRRRFFPSSGPVTLVMGPTSITVQGTSVDTRSRKSDEIKLPGEDEDQLTVTSKTRINAWDDQDTNEPVLAGDEESF